MISEIATTLNAPALPYVVKAGSVKSMVRGGVVSPDAQTLPRIKRSSVTGIPRWVVVIRTVPTRLCKPVSVDSMEHRRRGDVVPQDAPTSL